MFYRILRKDTGLLKEKLIYIIFKNINVNDFNNLCYNYSKKDFPLIIKKSFLDYIKKIKSLNDDCKIVIVSASVENYLTYWCKENNFDLIATRLEMRNNKLTGRFYGKNCNGIEKVNRIKERYNLLDYSKILTFGNSKGDKEMLELGTKSYYRLF